MAHSPLYTETDFSDISRELKKRWVYLLLPCALLAALLVFSLVIRVEWLTTASTIVAGVILIAGYDFFIKPVRCYRQHLDRALHGRTRQSELPFLAISEDVNLVDGVSFRSLTCQDVDGKGRPYDRLFYFDAMKPFPDYKPGEVLRVTHYDLNVANIDKA